MENPSAQPEQSPNERRKAARIPLLVRIECRTPQTYVLGHCENVSEAGMLILSKETFNIGNAVTVRFALPPASTGTIVQAEGTVVRAQEGNYMAIQFLRLQERYRLAIVRYIESSHAVNSVGTNVKLVGRRVVV